METLYTRKVNYYETDRMQIVHHTNYIRYFEEARIDFMDRIGCNVRELENLGLIIPNIDAYAKYMYSLKFDDVFTVHTHPVKFTGVKMKFEYGIYLEDKLAAEGFSTHCFVNRSYKPVSIKHSHPDIFNRLLNSVK